MRRRASIALAATLLAMLATARPAGAVYPDRPVRMIILTLPGGPTDVMFRGIAGVLSQSLGQPFVVESKPGGEGVIALQACLAARPDGHTLCMIDAYSFNMNPLLKSDLPYAPDDFAPIIHLGFLPAGLFVRKDLPVNSAEELFAAAKAQPGKLNWTTFGRASASYIYIEWLRGAKGIVFQDVPYKTAQDAFRAVLAGESDVVTYALTAGLNSGGDQLKLLGVTSAERQPLVPNVPAAPEFGMVPVGVWFGLAARKGTPDEILQLINRQIREKVIADPELRQRLFDRGGLALYGPAGKPIAEFEHYLQAERADFASVLEKAGITKE